MAKTTYVKITFGFDKSKLGTPKIYRRGKGATLADAIQDLFRQRGFNYLPQDQKDEIVVQINDTAGKIDQICKNVPTKKV